jgi:hypothetical protein
MKAKAAPDPRLGPAFPASSRCHQAVRVVISRSDSRAGARPENHGNPETAVPAGILAHGALPALALGDIGRKWTVKLGGKRAISADSPRNAAEQTGTGNLAVAGHVAPDQSVVL